MLQVIQKLLLFTPIVFKYISEVRENICREIYTVNPAILYGSITRSSHNCRISLYVVLALNINNTFL